MLNRNVMSSFNGNVIKVQEEKEEEEEKTGICSAQDEYHNKTKQQQHRNDGVKIANNSYEMTEMYQVDE